MVEVEMVTKPRSVHVPLTEAEWKALKVEATMSERTIGEVIADVLKPTLAQNSGSAASPPR